MRGIDQDWTLILWDHVHASNIIYCSHCYSDRDHDPLRDIIQGHDYSKSNNLKMVQHTAILSRPIESRIWSIERRHFHWPWTTPTSILWCWISHKRYDIRHNSFNEILIGTYTRPNQQCHFEWPQLTLSDLAKYSMTRSLWDSWASCLQEISWW